MSFYCSIIFKFWICVFTVTASRSDIMVFHALYTTCMATLTSPLCKVFSQSRQVHRWSVVLERRICKNTKVTLKRTIAYTFQRNKTNISSVISTNISASIRGVFFSFSLSSKHTHTFQIHSYFPDSKTMPPVISFLYHTRTRIYFVY